MGETPQHEPLDPSTQPTTPLSSRVLDAGVFVAGLVCLAFAIVTMGTPAPTVEAVALLTVPLIVVIARFPLVLDGENGGVEVAFDSCVLLFMLCTFPFGESLVLWVLGVTVTQLISQKRRYIKVFNVALSTTSGTLAGLLLIHVRGDARGELRELLAVTVAAAAYFTIDFLVSAVSLSLEERTPIRHHLVNRNSVIAVLCFVPFDLLGYLGALVVRSPPRWALLLLIVPLATLLVATMSLTRGAENARRLRELFEAARGAQSLTDPQQVVDHLISHARRLLRLRLVEVREAPPTEHEIGAQLRDGQRNSWLVAPAQHRARSTRSADQEALEAMAAVFSDALTRLSLTDDMVHLARHDLLTGLPNRGLLLDRVGHALQLSRRRGTQIALLFIDLDGFKPVNDRFGHAAGDAILVDFAGRLIRCVRQADTVARLGGDEFAILLEDVRTTEVTTACERILRELSSGADVAGHTLMLSASIGVAFGEEADTTHSLLRNADLAMYEAKSRGKNQFVTYEGALGQNRMQRLELVESLRASVAAGELTLVYQPVVRSATGQISGVEALARWRLNGVDISPEVFIKAAEESGLVVALGDVVLDCAARDAPRLREAAGDDFTVNVNISARQLLEPDFVEKVRETQERMRGLRLVLEITERDMVGDDAVSKEAMTRIADLGVAFAIDDFGIGFSSIGYLQDMPVKVIKTDLSFSEAIDRDERSCALLSSITMMGQALGLDVVVEGVERTSQLEHLRDHVRAPFAQGYLMYRPMRIEPLLEALMANRAEHPGVAAQNLTSER